MLTLKTNLAIYCQKSSIQSTFLSCLHTLFEAWVARCSPNSEFSHARKSFGTAGQSKQYAIIVRRRLINTHIRIHYHFSTFSEYCQRSTRLCRTNVINQKFLCVSHLFT